MKSLFYWTRVTIVSLAVSVALVFAALVGLTLILCIVPTIGLIFGVNQ